MPQLNKLIKVTLTFEKAREIKLSSKREIFNAQFKFTIVLNSKHKDMTL